MLHVCQTVPVMLEAASSYNAGKEYYASGGRAELPWKGGMSAETTTAM